MIFGRKDKDTEKKTMCRRAVAEIRQNQYDISSVRNAAELLQNEYDFDGPFPIVKMIVDAGFKIYTQDLKRTIGGYIVISNDIEEKFGTDKIIVVNEKENTNRQRFSLAHEFGHYLLDPGAKKTAEFYDAFESDDNKTDLELVIDRFAAELLMPEKRFISKYNEVKEQIVDPYDIFKALSDFFAVPPVSVEKRFSEVGIAL